MTFNVEKLKMKLPQIKAALNNINYKEALETARNHLNECGVALVLLEAVPTSKVRGATTIVNDIHAIYLSTRFKRIDVLYFALIHEIYHILNNDFSKITTYVTEMGTDNEIEANNFSKNFFISKELYQELVSKDVNYLSEGFIQQIAKRSGVIIDIVVGFLERYHKNQEPIYHRFTHMITRIDS